MNANTHAGHLWYVRPAGAIIDDYRANSLTFSLRFAQNSRVHPLRHDDVASTFNRTYMCREKRTLDVGHLRRSSGTSRCIGRRVILEQLEARCPLTTFYVSPMGDDTGRGHEDMPWRTLQHAADSVRAGDTVMVAPGNYKGFDLQTDGASERPIAFVASDGVVIDSPNSRTPDGINLEGADYVLIEGFEVTEMPRAGIRSVVNQHVAIRHNRTHDNGRWGIFTGFSEDVIIEHNETSGSVAEHGIYVSNSSDRPHIRNNLVWGNYASGIQINADASLGGDGIITEALVENNVIYGNGLAGGSAINLDGVQDSTIRNNLLYENHASGISLYRIDGAEGSRNNLVVNNTVIQAPDGRWALNIQDASTGNIVHNNILYNLHPFRGSMDVSADSLPGLRSDYNVVMERFTTDGGNSVMDQSAWQTATGHDAHSLIASYLELFVNVEEHDYRLASGALAVDQGTSQRAPATDLVGAMRPNGKAWDIGAFEHVALLGDFTNDNIVNAIDIDLLMARIHEMSHPLAFDLTGNGLVDRSDADHLVEEILGTSYGDADLNGYVNFTDFLVMASNFGKEGTWSTGDFDGDGVTQFSDFLLLASNYGANQ